MNLNSAARDQFVGLHGKNKAQSMVKDLIMIPLEKQREMVKNEGGQKGQTCEQTANRTLLSPVPHKTLSQSTFPASSNL